MKILVFTTLYPNARQPAHGVFVENRLRHLVQETGVEARVVAPVPWYPAALPAFGAYADYARVPRREHRHGIEVLHPAYPLIPKLGMTLAPPMLYAGARGAVRAVLEAGFDFDVIDAHYFYPDGVAAAMLAREFDRPLVVTGRGNDLTLLPRYRGPRAWLDWAMPRIDGMAMVCQALRDEVLARFDVEPERVRVLRNGVDLKQFTPRPANDVRRRLGIQGPLILSVGHLIERKGHDLVIRALTELPRATLLIAGKGPLRRSLETLAGDLGVASRVRFLGPVPHEALPDYYTAADLLVLASSREGWANVLLESLACGTPVVATAVSGTPEVIQAPVAGRLVEERSAPAIAAAIRDLIAAPPAAAEVRAYAEGFDWRETNLGQHAQFANVIAAHRARRPAPSAARS